MKKFLTILAIIFCAAEATAADNSWKIIPEQSKLEFKVAQGGSSISGAFKKFDGKIIFNKNQLSQSKIAIDVDTGSVAVSLPEAAGTIQTPEWLSTKTFPKATFISNKFSYLIGKKAYRVDGTLTLKGRPMPVSLEFSFAEYGEAKAVATGKAAIKRSAFLIGNSDVKKANGVQQDVEITFTIGAEK